MRLSVSLPSNLTQDVANWRHVFDFARACDEAGVDRIMAPDHVVFGEQLDAYGNPALGGLVGGSQPTGPDGNYFEPMTLLAALSGVTSEIRLGTGILLAALRRPVVLAKSAVTIDVLSGGRLDLGVGIGWQQEEYGAAGLNFKARGRLLDHTLEVCQLLWREKRASYESKDLTFSNIHAMPKPVQEGGVPIWVGGRVNQNVARRIARFGSGWITWDIGHDEMAESIAKMRALVADAGHGHDGAFPVQVGIFAEHHEDGRNDFGKTFASLPKLAEAGVTDVILYRLRTTFDKNETSQMAAEMVAEFRSAAAGARRGG